MTRPNHPQRRQAIHRLSVTAALAVLASLGLPQATQAQTAATAPTVGQALPPLSLKDQRDRPWSLKPDTWQVLFAAGRKASGMVQAVLEKEPKEFLAQRQAVYLADLSKMPGFATRMFALPALREMPFAVGVAMDESTLAAWPRQTDCVPLIAVANGVVQSVSYATTEADVHAALTR